MKLALKQLEGCYFPPIIEKCTLLWAITSNLYNLQKVQSNSSACGENRHWYITGECTIVQLQRGLWQYLTNLVCIYPLTQQFTARKSPSRNTYTNMKINVCSRLLIAALSAMTKFWKQPQFQHIGNWLKRPCYIHIVEYYAAVKKSKDRLYEVIWNDF